MSRANNCRFCNTPLYETFCDLGMSPLSNSYLTEDGISRQESFYPLHAYVCDECRKEKLSGYRQDIFTDSDYWHDEPIDAEE